MNQTTATTTAAPQTRTRLFAASALAAGIAVAIYGYGTANPASAEPTVATAALAGVAVDALPGSFSSLVKAVRPSVVHVDTTATRRNTGATGMPPGLEVPEQFRRFFEGRRFGPGSNGAQPVRGIGSGFIVDSAGLIVTNNHVIDSADDITITLHDGTELKAELVGSDPKTDLALLRVRPSQPLTAARFADSDHAEVGDWVVAVGSPFGLGGTVTAGIISARGRDINSGPYDDFLQVDAPINRGNSGGPLFNRRGEVVGVNTAIFSPSGGNIGIGFAIPANQATPIIGDLKSDGKVQRGWLGVSIQKMDETLAQSLGLGDEAGALISEVSEDSPASRANLRTGDVVLGFAGQPIESPKDLSRAVAAQDTDQTVELRVWRDGAERTVDVTLGALGAEQRASVDDPATAPAAKENGPRVGLALAPLNEAQKSRYGLDADETGVLVAAVEPGGPAARQGIAAGDVIIAVSRQSVAEPQDVVDAVQAAASGDEQNNSRVLMLVNRDGNQRFVAVPIERAGGNSDNG